MVQIVLMSERAGELIDLGKSRLNALRQQGRAYASSYLATRYGFIIAQILGNTERVLIDNKPPYLLIDVFQYDAAAGGNRYKPSCGGVGGEPYMQTYIAAPPELQGIPDLGQASAQYMPMGRYAYTTLSAQLDGIYCYLAVAVLDTDSNKMRFVYGNYSTVNLAGQSLCAFAPVGRADDGGEHMAYSYRTTTGPDDENQKSSISIVLHNTDAANPPEAQVWPLLGDNDGYSNEIAQVVTMANAGRMRVAWFQEYADTRDSVGTLVHRAKEPTIVVYSVAAGTYATHTLRSLTPELEPIFAADPDAYNKLSPFKGIAYCGGGIVVICFSYVGVSGAEKMLMFRTADGGASWNKVTLPLADGEHVAGGMRNEHALRSLAPGKVMLTTLDGSTMKVYFSEDAGGSWASFGSVDTSTTSTHIAKYLPFLQAPRRKIGKEFLYTATRHDPAAGKVRELTFDSFHPSAQLIKEEVIISDSATYVPSPTQIFNASAYVERGAPLLQGYVNELEGTA